jgi:hypothetical protein
MGERFFDILIADTLSERYRPCKEIGNNDQPDDQECLRTPLSRACDWFAGLFAIDPTITID